MEAPKNLEEFCERFRKIKEIGWIETHREGRTGIGKTLEDLLGIEENNNDEADFAGYELKAMRSNGSEQNEQLGLLTLLTKSPLPKGVNSKLRETYGYESEKYANKRKVLHSTLDTKHFAKVEDTGFFLKVNCIDDKIQIVDNNGNVPAYWTEEILKKAFLKKYPKGLVHVFADSDKIGTKEKFRFHTAILFYDFSFKKMVDFLNEGLIKADIRIGQYKNGKTHDHGTGFRIQDRYLTEIFLNKRILVEDTDEQN